MSSLFLLLFISFFLFSCSNNLSRENAKDLIVQKYNLPQIETIKMGKKYYISQQGDRGDFGMEKVAIVTAPYYSEFKK